MDNPGKSITMPQQREIEAVVWKGSFADAEHRDDVFWMEQTAQQRLAAMLHLREIFFPDADVPMEKIVSKRKFGEEE